MGLADELERLRTLRDEGSLDEEEFAKAKSYLLTGASAADIANRSNERAEGRVVGVAQVMEVERELRLKDASVGDSSPPSASTAAASGNRAQGGSPTHLYAWLLAIVPLGWLVFDFVTDFRSPWLATWLIAMGINAGLSWLDINANQQLHEAERSRLLGWAAFLLPVYLFKRAKLLGDLPAQGVVWLVLFAVSLIPWLGGAGIVMDANYIEATIREQSRAQGIYLTHVNCPEERLARKDEAFMCEVRAGSESAFVRVDVLNEQGDFQWSL